MSYNGHPVIDMDSHLFEGWDWSRTFDANMDQEYREKWADLRKGLETKSLGNLVWPRAANRPLGVLDAFAGQIQPIRGNASGSHGTPNSRRGSEIDPATNWDAAVRLRDMDRASIDISVIFCSYLDGLCWMQDVGFEAAMNRAYHRYMSDYCAEGEGRLRWLANAVIRDVPEAVAQLRHWAEHDENFSGVFLPRACPDGTMLDTPLLHPLFAASQELDLPIWIHGGAYRPPLTPWVDATNGVYHGIGGLYALHGLIGGGVFDLFPKLRVGLFESGCGWLPWAMEKLDALGPDNPMTPNLKRTPSEILEGGQIFCSVEPDETFVEHAVEVLGEDIWLFSTDYPHSGTPWPDGVSMIAERALPESAKIKLLGENARRLLPRLGSTVGK